MIYHKIQNNQDFYDKHTTKYINEVIEKKWTMKRKKILSFNVVDKESRRKFKIYDYYWF